MKRAILLGLGALGLAAVLLPAIAMADSGFPPGPPATFYGTTPSGISVGQGVIAIVVNGSSSTVCGAGSVVADTDNGGKPSYAVDVVSASQITGCGVSGSTVMFYFTPFGGHSGQLATDTATWICAAGGVRPGIAMALQHSENKPDKAITVFAGADIDATDKARDYFTGYAPSSPAIGLLKNGELVKLFERRDLEGRPPQVIAQELENAFEQYCSPAGAAEAAANN